MKREVNAKWHNWTRDEAIPKEWLLPLVPINAWKAWGRAEISQECWNRPPSSEPSSSGPSSSGVHISWKTNHDALTTTGFYWTLLDVAASSQVTKLGEWVSPPKAYNSVMLSISKNFQSFKITNKITSTLVHSTMALETTQRPQFSVLHQLVFWHERTEEGK